MNCRNLQNNLIGYIEKTLPPSLISEIKLHIEECETCKLLYSQTSSTYLIFEKAKNNSIPDLFPGISRKLSKHHTSVIEFVPRYKIIFRVAASITVILGIGIGILVGGKYTSSKNSLSQVTVQEETLDFYSTIINPMDGETGLALLYTNE